MKLSLLMSKKSLSAEFQKEFQFISGSNKALLKALTYKPSMKLSSSLSQQRFQFYPYWKILENSFSEISVFWGVTQTDYWKTPPVSF